MFYQAVSEIFADHLSETGFIGQEILQEARRHRVPPLQHLVDFDIDETQCCFKIHLRLPVIGNDIVNEAFRIFPLACKRLDCSQEIEEGGNRRLAFDRLVIIDHALHHK